MKRRTIRIANDAERIRKRRNIIAIAIITLIAIAILIVANFNNLENKAAESVSTYQISKQRKNKQTKKPSFNMSAVQPVSPATLANAWIHRSDYQAIGQIAIPDYGIGLNIYAGVGNVELNLGAGTLRADQKMGKGNYPLAAHNMDDGRSFFSPLFTAKVNGNLRVGTSIYLTDFKKVYYYKLTSSKFIGIYNFNLAFDTPEFKKHPVISLFTCDYTGAGRLFIRGKLTGEQSVKDVSSYIRNSFSF